MTSLTPEFGFDAFREEYGGDALLLFALRDRRLLIAAVDTPNPFSSRLQPGDQLFWLGEEKQPTQSEPMSSSPAHSGTTPEG
jgi:hypothetical protein